MHYDKTDDQLKFLKPITNTNIIIIMIQYTTSAIYNCIYRFSACKLHIGTQVHPLYKMDSLSKPLA